MAIGAILPFVPALLQVLLRLAPWVGAWLALSKVEDITEDVTDPENPVGGAIIGIGGLAVVGLAVFLFLTQRGSK